MLIGLNSSLRFRRRLSAAIVAMLLALAIIAAHSAAGTDHEPNHHDSLGAQSAMVLCLAVLGAGAAIAVAAIARKSRRRPTTDLRPAFSRMASPSPEIAGLGPPGERLSLFQVFLR